MITPTAAEALAVGRHLQPKDLSRFVAHHDLEPLRWLMRTGPDKPARKPLRMVFGLLDRIEFGADFVLAPLAAKEIEIVSSHRFDPDFLSQPQLGPATVGSGLTADKATTERLHRPPRPAGWVEEPNFGLCFTGSDVDVSHVRNAPAKIAELLRCKSYSLKRRR